VQIISIQILAQTPFSHLLNAKLVKIFDSTKPKLTPPH